jgi:ketosteroid isomerase-like protein
MSLQQKSAAVAAARAHVEAWSKRDYDAARAALADDVWITAIAADPSFPKTDLNGVEAYMQGLIQFADGIVAGSTDVVDAVGDDKQALLTVNARVKYGPDAPEMDAPAARMYVFDDDGKIKIEHVVFFLS